MRPKNREEEIIRFLSNYLCARKVKLERSLEVAVRNEKDIAAGMDRGAIIEVEGVEAFMKELMEIVNKKEGKNK